MTDTNARIARLQTQLEGMTGKVDALDRKIDQNSAGQQQLVRELHELTSTLKVLVERQDNSRESSDRMWKLYEKLKGDMDELKSFRDTNLPILNGVRALNQKIVMMVFAALLAGVVAPVATVTYLIKQMDTRYEQTLITPRDKTE